MIALGAIISVRLMLIRCSVFSVQCSKYSLNLAWARTVRVLLAVLAISYFASESLYAQVVAPKFGGTVLDDGGNVVPEAFVVLFQGGNLTRTVRADVNGKFEVTGYITGGSAVIGAQRIGYRISSASRRELAAPDLAIELRLDRERSSRSQEKVRVHFGGLVESAEIAGVAIAFTDAVIVHWKLERKGVMGWTSVEEKDALPAELFRHQIVAADVNGTLHREFRLVATIQYPSGNEEASHTFVVSKESRLIDGER